MNRLGSVNLASKDLRPPRRSALNCQRILVLLITVLFSTLTFAAEEVIFTIKGVSDPVRNNIEKRLDELQQIKPIKAFSQEELRAQIDNALQPFGYFRAEIRIQNEATSEYLITIKTGSQLIISSFSLELIGPGSQNPSLVKLVKEIPFKTGYPLLTEQYNKTKLNFINTAENLGYLHAHFDKAEIRIDTQQYTASIRLIFNTGPLFYFGQVQFDPTYIAPELLHRFVPFKPSDAFSTDKILQFNNYLSSSGYFSSVLIKPDITDAQTVPVNVHLQPVSKYSYSLGAGYGTDTGIRGRAALHVIPVNRWGHKFNAVAQGSVSQNVLQAQYVVPAKNPVTDQYSLTGNFSNLNYTSGNSNSILISLAEQHIVDQYQQIISINGLDEQFKYAFQPNSDRFVLYPKATLSFTSVKNKLFSPSGFALTLNGWGSSKDLLSGINAAQLSVDAKAAFMFEPLRLRLYGHALQGLTATDDVNTLPLSLALLLGGTDNLKGYSFNSIGPGRVISYAGFEIQKEVVKNWYVLSFYDAGSVYNPNPKYTQYDVGAGLMWVSPIGPIKAGLAQPINNNFQRIGGSSPRLVISMGPDL